MAIRSKNAGPTLLTLDIILPTEQLFAKAVDAIPKLRVHVSERYGKPLQDVRIFPHPPSLAIKVTIPRDRISGVVGDSHVYGAQQHAPLLEFEL